MGIILGLLGAGGSILTIPILVYIFKIPVQISMTYSLFIVGLSSIIGSIRYRNLISFKVSSIFIIPSIIGVSLARSYIIHALPSTIAGFSVDSILMLFLSILMMVASYFMLSSNIAEESKADMKSINVAIYAFIFGILMGIFGVGGGFLIVPTLVLFLHMQISSAIPTSLFIIALNSIFGILFDKSIFDYNDYGLLCILISIALIGMMFGIKIGKRIQVGSLKVFFGWFILLVAILIILRELLV